MSVYALVHQYHQFFRALFGVCDSLEESLQPCLSSPRLCKEFYDLQTVLADMRAVLRDSSELPVDSLPSMVMTEEMHVLEKEKEVLADELRRVCCERLVLERRAKVEDEEARVAEEGESDQLLEVGVGARVERSNSSSRRWRTAPSCTASSATRSTSTSCPPPPSSSCRGS